MERVDIDKLLEKPFWVIDILPKQVPAGSPGQYFVVERYFATERTAHMRSRRLSMLLKLNCYFDLLVSTDVGESWVENPKPGELESLLGAYLHIALPAEHALFVADPDDTYLTLYNPGEELLDLVHQLAASEGLFVWQPPQE